MISDFDRSVNIPTELLTNSFFGVLPPIAQCTLLKLVLLTVQSNAKGHLLLDDGKPMTFIAIAWFLHADSDDQKKDLSEAIELLITKGFLIQSDAGFQLETDMLGICIPGDTIGDADLQASLFK